MCGAQRRLTRDSNRVAPAAPRLAGRTLKRVIPILREARDRAGNLKHADHQRDRARIEDVVVIGHDDWRDLINPSESSRVQVSFWRKPITIVRNIRLAVDAFADWKI